MFIIDLENSYMIGDSENDILAGKNAGCKTVLIGKEDYQQDKTASSLLEAVEEILR
jgi:phosphoglycolate phosphatase-like HAD superfamily hydrolase